MFCSLQKKKNNNNNAKNFKREGAEVATTTSRMSEG